VFHALYAAVLLAALLAGTNIRAAEPLSQQRQDELIYLLHQDCGSCHGMTLQGGLGPSLLPAALAGKPAQYLQRVISKGVPEKAMPPWENILQPEEINFLVVYLQQATAQ
jgi:cytochrome c55X